MSVYHLVWIKFADGVPAERIESHLQALRSLRTRVPGVLDLTLGANFTDRANGCTHGLVVTLQDRQALSNYATHPDHVAVASAVRQDAQILALDYED